MHASHAYTTTPCDIPHGVAPLFQNSMTGLERSRTAAPHMSLCSGRGSNTKARSYSLHGVSIAVQQLQGKVLLYHDFVLWTLREQL